MENFNSIRPFTNNDYRSDIYNCSRSYCTVGRLTTLGCFLLDPNFQLLADPF